MRYDILFETSRFNVSEPKEHFINPCCFGEDSVAWLREKLVERGVQASAPGQEDWGWYLQAKWGKDSYFVGLGGYLKENAASKNDGKWRVMIEKHQSIWDRLCHKNKISEDEPILAIIETIFRAEPDIRQVRRETGG
jgi:hypothetical protein